MINGKVFSHEDISVVCNKMGFIFGVKKIDFSHKKPSKAVYALGSAKAIAYVRGKFEGNGSLEILLETWTQVTAASKVEDGLYKMKPQATNIVVSFANDEEPPIGFMLMQIAFDGFSFGSTDDGEQTIKLDFNILGGVKDVTASGLHDPAGML
ncbi:MAG: hypothetical protein A2086_03355 [Spirochaetes bacterium GWD1_27_9]|nr:MAG: hypothetical protein A2Z98_12585 [Spirochaetes bacterium GWB1_27_13]OHD45286.1 MAG: hypothetical protein A2086_03355 [Spirochaetes bacterium GWD1_27_9]